MKQYPQIPRVDDAPDELFESGHLWVLEKLDGAQLRFQVQPSGFVRFGDRQQVYEGPDAVPEPYQHAVRHVRTTLNRDILRGAVDDVTDVVFFGEAMHQHTLDYEWTRTPSFLGFDIWSAQEEAFRPPGAAERIFKRLGLQPVNAVERELPVRDFDPDSYSVPPSHWYDGPAAGVVIRNKREHRAKLLPPDFQPVDSVTVEASPEQLADRYVTDRRIDRHLEELEGGGPDQFDAVYERMLEEILRENHRPLFLARHPVDMRSFRSAVAERIRMKLENNS